MFRGVCWRVKIPKRALILAALRLLRIMLCSRGGAYSLARGRACTPGFGLRSPHMSSQAWVMYREAFTVKHYACK